MDRLMVFYGSEAEYEGMGKYMKIAEILAKEEVGISCELFPPKLGKGLVNVKKL